MRPRSFLAAALLGLVLLGGVAAEPHRPVSVPKDGVEPAVSRQVAEALGSLPLGFDPYDVPGAATSFAASGEGYAVALSDGGDATVSLSSARGADRSAGPTDDIRIRLGGARARPAGRGHDRLPGRRNFFLGAQPGRWRADVPRYGAVVYEGVYPGVDLVYHGQQRRLEFDFVLAPGVDAGVIDVVLDGPEQVTLDPAGDLVLRLPGGPGGPGGPDGPGHARELRMPKPFIYQEVSGSRRAVPGGFVLREAGHVGFELGPHDAGRPVVIDPVLVNSTYLGGSGVDSSYAVAVDSGGNTYVTGYTESTDLQTVAPLQPGLRQAGAGAQTDAFVAKLNRAGTGIVFATYLGGGGRDTGHAIAIGPDGGVYVSGTTESVDFPTQRPVQAAYGGGTSDAFLVKLSATGSVLDYATTLGGTGVDAGRGVDVDNGGNAYVTGSTISTDFPTASPLQAALGGESDAFVTKVNPAGSALVYSTYLGGAADEHALAVAVDNVGDAYVTGDTNSENFPTVRPLQPRYAGAGAAAGRGDVAGDAFLTRLDRAGSALVYSTYLGGNESDSGTGVALDRDANVYLTGSTGSANFPLAKAHQPRKSGDFDAFVAALDARGSALTYSTYLGGGSSDGGTAVAADAEGRAWVVGATSSSDFPTADPFQQAKGGGFVDAFVASYSPSGADLEFSSYIGGGDEDQATAVALDAEGTAQVAGYTNSSNFPTTGGLRASKTGTVGDAFLTRVGDRGAAGSVAAPAATSARDGRVRLLIGTTIGLLLAAVLLTVWLRIHPASDSPAPATTGEARPRRADDEEPYPTLSPVSPRRGAAAEPTARAGPQSVKKKARNALRRAEPKVGAAPGNAEPTARAAPQSGEPTARAAPQSEEKRARRLLRRRKPKVGAAPETGEQKVGTAPQGGEPWAPTAPQSGEPNVGAASERAEPWTRAAPQSEKAKAREGGERPAPVVPPPEPARGAPTGLGLGRRPERGTEGPSGPSERGTEGPSGPSERGTEGPSGPSEPWIRQPEEAPAPPEIPAPDLLPPIERRDYLAPIDAAEPDLWDDVTEIPELAPDEMAAWELLISGPAPASYLDDDLAELLQPDPEPAGTRGPGPPAPEGRSDSGPPAPEGRTDAAAQPGVEARPAESAKETSDLWAEDLPITPSSEPGSGDDWLRLLWSEDLPLPDEVTRDDDPPPSR